jgi:hypothetical protein
MQGISKEENRRFEELVGTLQGIDKKMEKKANKKRYLIIYSSIALLAGFAIIIGSISIKQPLVGLGAFIGMTFSLEFILGRFLR